MVGTTKVEALTQHRRSCDAQCVLVHNGLPDVQRLDAEDGRTFNNLEDRRFFEELQQESGCIPRKDPQHQVGHLIWRSTNGEVECIKNETDITTELTDVKNKLLIERGSA